MTAVSATPTDLEVPGRAACDDGSSATDASAARRWEEPHTWSVVVSGGSSGLGRALCGRLSDLGARVVSLDRATCADIDTVQVDLADTIAAADATQQAIGRLGAVDAVVCCAGVDVPGPLDTVELATWDRIIAVNLLGTAAIVRAALPTLRARRGRVVTVASTLGHRAVGDATAYCASKFGVVGFTRALMAELKGQVGVTLVTPGGMSTAFFDDRSPQYQPAPGAPLADPCDVASAIVFALCQPPGCEVKELVVAGPEETSWP
jgi:NAD(P)-dependent dehydrogenase (short-subunit alcohol dehydrogenase family)